MRFAAVLILLTAPPLALHGQPPVVALSGVVGQIHIQPGQGMPYFDLKSGDTSARVYLGPMPFLIAQNFNLKTGQEVTIRGYKTQDWIMAVEVTLVAGNKNFKFRDAQGRPLWRGGFGRRAGRNL